MTLHQRYDITFTGRVQGVFFRATTQDIATRFDVTGYVRNQADGSVRLVAEGVPSELERFVQAVHDAKRDYIDDITRSHSEATGEFTGFTIRH